MFELYEGISPKLTLVTSSRVRLFERMMKLVAEQKPFAADEFDTNGRFLNDGSLAYGYEQGGQYVLKLDGAYTREEMR